MANSNSNRTLVPEAKESLNKFKYEVASDMCVKNIFTLISSSYFVFLRAIKIAPTYIFWRTNNARPYIFYAGCFN